MGIAKKRRPLQVSDTAYQAIRELAEAHHTSMAKIVERAVEHYGNQLMLLQANAEWAEILRDPEAVAEIEAERKLWDTTTADGLEGQPWAEREC
ncbi:MAG TPA: hypothetical protein VFI42_11390 [Thermomicrobiaceae bacterium]|nr:hypothetical protein [Thermomicrobiaceae bacterium]